MVLGVVFGLGFGSVPLQPARELLGLAESDEVPVGHLIDRDAQAVPNDLALELHGKETVVAALQESDGHVGPCCEGP